MSDLAYNINGESFELPETAQCWRVRRMKQRGAPEVVYGREGVPLTIPIESDLENLRRAVDAPGRYRLDAADERGRALPDVPAAYVHVASVIEPATEAAAELPAPTRLPAPDSAVTEAMRLNTELAKSVIDRFPEMMHAAAELLRAADGAGLPARAPRQLADEFDDDEDADREPAPAGSPGFELFNTLVAQVVPMVVTALTGRKPTLAELFDWRKAVPEAAPAQLAAAASSSAEPPPAGADTEEPLLDAPTMAHFLAIMQALTPEERALGQALAGELAPSERAAWMSELKALPVADAVSRVRELLGDARRAGGAA